MPYAKCLQNCMHESSVLCTDTLAPLRLNLSSSNSIMDGICLAVGDAFGGTVVLKVENLLLVVKSNVQLLVVPNHSCHHHNFSG